MHFKGVVEQQNPQDAKQISEHNQVEDGFTQALEADFSGPVVGAGTANLGVKS